MTKMSECFILSDINKDKNSVEKIASDYTSVGCMSAAPKITIIGAGPVGILVACGLGKMGFDVCLLEKQNEADLKQRGNRAKLSRLYAISLGSYEVMSSMLGIKLDTSDFQPINRIAINDGSAGTIFKPEEIDEKVFGYMVEESDLFDQLLRHLDGYSKNVKVIYGISNLEIQDGEFLGRRSDLESSNIKLLIDGQCINSDLIIAADGRSSILRKQLPFGENYKDYKEKALVFAIRHSEFAHCGLAVEAFLPSGPFAILPHADPHRSSVVWSAENGLVESFLTLSDEEKFSIISDRLPEYYGNFVFDSEFITYPLHLITLEDLYYKNVLLLGDSSHVVHPVAGQGFNLGIRDVRDILKILGQYQFYTDFDHMLGEYQNLRKSDIRKLVSSTDFLLDLFSNNNSFLKKLRRISLRFFDNLPRKQGRLRYNTIKYAAGK